MSRFKPSAKLEPVDPTPLATAAKVIADTKKDLYTVIANAEDKLLKDRKRTAPDPAIKHFCSTGCLPFDYAINHRLRNGGLPGAQITELFGPETAGKTVTALTIGAYAQSVGGMVVFIDLERRLNRAQLAITGIDTEGRWIYKRPETAEEALEDISYFLSLVEVMHDQVPLVIIVDSIAMLAPTVNLKKKLTDSPKVAAIAGLLTRFLREKNQHLPNKNAYLIFINQVRSDVDTSSGSTGGRMWSAQRRPLVGHKGNYEVPGGHCLLHMEHIRVQLERVDVFTDEEGEVFGSKVEATIVKNSLSPFLRKARYPIFFREDQPELGVSNIWACLDYLNFHKLIPVNGSWYTVGGVKGQGFVKLYEAVLADGDAQEHIADMVFNHFQRWATASDNMRMGLTQK